MNEMINIAIFKPTKGDPCNIEEVYKDKIGKNLIKECIITPDNNELYGFLYNKNKKPSWNDDNIFLYSHGNSGYIGSLLDRSIINLLSDYGSVFLYDYRGYGLSTGIPSEDGVYQDIKSVWDFLTTHKKVPSNNIIIYGHSLGAAISSNLVSILSKNNNELPKALILEAPFLSIKKIAGKRIPSILHYFVASEFDNYDNVKKINKKIPIFILHSKQDDTVPYDHGKELAKLTGNTFIEIKGLHNYPDFTNEAKNMLANISQ